MVPHQLMPGPRHHRSLEDVALAYINYLEERCNVYERELGAMHERFGHQLYPLSDDLTNQMEAVRAKNTELEVKNRELKALSQEQHAMLEQATDACTRAQERLSAMAEELRTVKERNATLTNQARSRGVNEFVEAAGHWTRDTFDEMVWRSPIERGARLVEEAIECAQVAGVPSEMVDKIRRKVYSKPVGHMKQELGGVIICWGSMVSALGFDGKEIINDALADCWDRQQQIREKWLLKVQDGTSVKFDKPFEMPKDPGLTGRGFDPRTGVGQAITRNIPEEAYKVRVDAPYSDAPMSHDQRSDQIIEEGRKNLKTHVEATRSGGPNPDEFVAASQSWEK